jgi:hypothetical protein
MGLIARKIEKTLPFFIFAFPISLLIGKSASDVLISSACLFFVFWSWKTNTWNWAKKPWFIILIILWGYMCLRSIWTPFPLDALKTALPYGRYFIFAALFSILPLAQNPNKDRLLWILCSVTLFICAETLAQWIFGHDLFGRVSPYGHRLTGPFSRPLVGVYLSWLSFPLVTWLSGKPFSIKKPFYFLFFTLMGSISLCSVYASGERTALIGTFLCYGTLVVLTQNFKTLFLIIVIISAFLGILYLVKIPTHQPVHKTNTSEKYEHDLESRIQYDQSDEKEMKGKLKIKQVLKNLVRIIKSEINLKIQSSKSSYNTVGGYGLLFQDALRLFRKNFIFGIGPNQFSHLCHISHSCSGVKKHCCDYRHPHNVWLNILSSIGIIGFSFFAAFFFNIFRQTSLKWPSLKKNTLFLGLLCVVIYRFFPIAGGMSIFFNSNAHIIWFIIGWLLCFLAKPDNSLAREPSKA